MYDATALYATFSELEKIRIKQAKYGYYGQFVVNEQRTGQTVKRKG